MPLAAENRKLSHVQRKKSNLTQRTEILKSNPKEIIIEKSKTKLNANLLLRHIQRKSDCKSWSILIIIIIIIILFIYLSNTPGKNSLRQRQQPVAAENRAHVARGMTLKKKLYIDDLTVLVGPHA